MWRSAPTAHRSSPAVDDNTVRLWDATPANPSASRSPATPDAVISVAFSPDGTRIVSGSGDKHGAAVGRGHRPTRSASRSPATPTGCTSVAFSPDGTRHRLRQSRRHGAAVGRRHRPARSASRSPATPSAVSSVAFSPDGSASPPAVGDETVRLWDAATGQPVGQPLTGHTGAVTSVAFSPDGTRIASGSADNTVRLWDAAPATRRPAADRPHGRGVAAWRSAPTARDRLRQLGQHGAAVGRGHRQPVGQPLTGHTGAVYSVAFSPDGTRLASGSDDNTVRLWDAATGQPVGDAADRPHRRGVQRGVQPRRHTHRLRQRRRHGAAVAPYPDPASAMCAKLTTNMSHQQWRDWVSPDIDYIKVCPDLPVAPD